MFTFDLNQPTTFSIVDVNSTVPFSPGTTITQPAGHSIYMYKLRTADRAGSTDQVSVFVDDVFVVGADVPVNCGTGTAEATVGPVLSSGTAGPTASNTLPTNEVLANTGAPIGKILLIAFFMAAFAIAMFMIRWCIPSSKNRGNHE